MFVGYERFKEFLEGIDFTTRYGYGYYLKNGFVFPSQSLIASEFCFKECYGDCEAIAVRLAEILVASGVPSEQIEIWLVNLPLFTMDNRQRAIRHILPVVRENNKVYILGFTPYDYLINGRMGIFEESEYCIPLEIRDRIDFRRYRRIFFMEKLKRGYLKLKKNKIFIRELKEDWVFFNSNGAQADLEGKKILILDMICNIKTCCPVGWYKDINVFVEMSVLRGEKIIPFLFGYRKENLVGYQVNLYHDVFDSVCKALFRRASFSAFLVVPIKSLPRFRKIIGQWKPSETLGRLLNSDFSKFLEIYQIESERPELLEEAFKVCGQELYDAILHTYAQSYGANDLRARDVYSGIS